MISHSVGNLAPASPEQHEGQANDHHEKHDRLRGSFAHIVVVHT